jgi:hypothetical protein
VTLEQVTTKNNFEEILKDFSNQVFETKYTLNLGQLLQVIPNVKCYILSLVLSKPVLPKLIVVSIAIDHSMAMI